MNNRAPKTLVLCADDFGQSAAISGGIIELVDQRRLSAVSCMTEAPFWNSPDNPLARYQDLVDIGLHFNLTHPFPGQVFAAQPLGTLLRAALLGKLDANELDAALHAQLDRFETILGRAPDFVDGHQHVHVFPQIRARLLHVLTQRYPDSKPWLRAVNPALEWRNGAIKLTILKTLGLGFESAARQRGFRLNSRFAGIYSLRPDADFAALMRQWLAATSSGALIMCHPGRADTDPLDEIAKTRPVELAVLGGDSFTAMLAENRVELVRFRALNH